MEKVLIINGHPKDPASFANDIILKEVQEQMPEAVIRNLYEEIDGKHFNVELEQNALREADVVVFQFPVFWYSVPALLKQYMDEIFLRGFSHGSTGKALHGKKFIASFTTGAPEEVYTHDGFIGFSLENLLRPLSATSKMVGFKTQPFVHSSAMAILSAPDQKAEITGRAKDHAARLVEAIKKAE